jgi:hypothetical protein
VLEELLPLDDRGRVEVQAAAAFLGRATRKPEIAADLVSAGTRLTYYVAAQIRSAHPEITETAATLDAAGLLALLDGLIAHTLTGRRTLEKAQKIMNNQLDRIFGAQDTNSTRQ